MPGNEKRERNVEEKELQERVVKILTPYVKNKGALAAASATTSILDDLEVNSARLIDVVLAFEDEFEIEIADEDVDEVETIGDCLALISGKV